MTDDSLKLTANQKIFINNIDILISQCYTILLDDIRAITVEEPRKPIEKYARLVGLLHIAKLEMQEKIV